MAVSGFLSSSVFHPSPQLSGQSCLQTNPHHKFRQSKQDFQPLGSDLSTEDISQEQSDFAGLEPVLPGSQQSFRARSTTTAVASAVSSGLNISVWTVAPSDQGQALKPGPFVFSSPFGCLFFR